MSSGPFTIGSWEVDPASNRLSRDGEQVALEPKVMDLLITLSQRPGEVRSKDDLLHTLWPGLTLGEDVLARAVSKLRRALGDDVRAPAYLQTIPKRGYRLLAEVRYPEPPAPHGLGKHKPSRGKYGFAIAVSAILAISMMIAATATGREDAAEPELDRADQLYMNFQRPDNETAIELYERALDANPASARAHLGVSNGLVQRVIRWHGTGSGDLSTALENRLTQSPYGRATLERAHSHARRAVAAEPDNPEAWKAMGLVLAARGDNGGASQAYRRALTLNPSNWPALINLGELSAIEGDDAQALQLYERAFAAMAASSRTEPQKVQSWRAGLGVRIADTHLSAGRTAEAEAWYRRVLDIHPLHGDATLGLAKLAHQKGSTATARQLCSEVTERTGRADVCGELFP